MNELRLDLFDIKEFIEINKLQEVTSAVLFQRGDVPHPNGLVSNEIFNARAKILSQNIERLGVANAVVCNESPDRMAEHFSDFFNKDVLFAKLMRRLTACIH